jgi:hypothetical protein
MTLRVAAWLWKTALPEVGPSPRPRDGGPGHARERGAGTALGLDDMEVANLVAGSLLLAVVAPVPVLPKQARWETEHTD